MKILLGKKQLNDVIYFLTDWDLMMQNAVETGAGEDDPKRYKEIIDEKRRVNKLINKLKTYQEKKT